MLRNKLNLPTKYSKRQKILNVFSSLFLFITIFFAPISVVNAENSAAVDSLSGLLPADVFEVELQKDSAFFANYAQIVYNDENGNTQNDANDVFQTSDGYIWIGSYQGLTRYDGKNFTLFNKLTYDPEKFNAMSVRALYEDDNGTLWIGSNDNGVIYYRNGDFASIDNLNVAPSQSIRKIVGDPNRDIVYFATSDGIYYINGNFETVLIDEPRIANCFASDIFVDNNSNLFVITNTGAFFVYTADGVLYDYSDNLVIANYPATALKIYDDNKFAVGTQNGSVILGSLGQDFKPAFSKIYTNACGNSNINQIYIDQQDRIWVCGDNGLGYIDTDLVYYSLKGAEITVGYEAMCQDSEGNFWFASSVGGTLHAVKSNFTDYFFEHDLPASSINATIKYHDYLYIGTDNGLIINDADGNMVYNELTDLIGTIRVRSIFRDSKDKLWFGTYSDASVTVYDYNNNSIKQFFNSDGLISNRTRNFAELNDGTILVGTNEGVYFIEDERILTNDEISIRYPNFADIPDTVILSMLQGADGTLYIGSDGSGIYRFSDEGASVIDMKKGLSGNIIMRMTCDTGSNGIWASTSSGLAYISETGEINNIDGLDIANIYDIIFINDEDMLILTNSRIIKVGRSNLLDPNPPQMQIIQKSSGLSSSINSNAWNYLDENGMLYICCYEGVNVFNTNPDSEEKTIPNAVINYITIDNQRYVPADRINLPRNLNRLTIDASLLTFGLENSYSVEFMLEGQDSAPVTMTIDELKQHSISYTNIDGGDYTFRITSTDYEGNRGKTTTIFFHKELAFFENTLVQLALILLAITVVVLITLIVTRAKAEADRKKALEYRKITVESITAIVNTIDAKDNYTRGHSIRVAEIAVEISKRLKMPNEFVERIYYLGLLHDIGKIATPIEILNKPGSLTKEEYDIIKLHPLVGYNILKGMTTIKNVALGARDHHERYDGTGYNQGLKGEEISIEARIICGADTYDAMASRRSYRNPISQEIIAEEFKKYRGTQFDPAVADAVIDMIADGYFDNWDDDKHNEAIEIKANEQVVNNNATL